MEDAFRHEPAADHPGWMTWELKDGERFNGLLGPMLVRLDPDGRARCRIFPTKRHSNLSDNIHGGAILAFADVALFGGAHTLGIATIDQGVTIECNATFFGAGRIGEPLDAVIELLRETGRLIFLRGTMEQGTERIGAFSGTLRKVTGGRTAQK